MSVLPSRKDGGRVFVKRSDPHEEALMILKGQMSHQAAAPGTQVRVQLWQHLGKGRTEPVGASETTLNPAMKPCLSHACLLFFGGGSGAQRDRGPGEAGDQCSEAIHGAHSR